MRLQTSLGFSGFSGIRQASAAARRSVHIAATETLEFPHSPDGSTTNHISPQVEFLSEIHGTDATKFRLLGEPPTLVSVHLQPRDAVTTRRGAVVAFQSRVGESVNSVTMGLRVVNPLYRLLFRMPWILQHVANKSSTDCSALLKPPTALFSSSTLRTLGLISLDGRYDWLVFPRKAVHSFAGAHLSVTPRWRPMGASGLWSPWNLGYTQISGRGDVVLQGNGHIYQIGLEKGEEVLIQKGCLLAVSTRESRLDDLVAEFEVSSDLPTQEPFVEVVGSEKARKQEIDDEEYSDESEIRKTVRKIWTASKYGVAKTAEAGRAVYNQIVAYTRKRLAGTEEFVKVRGPRVVLVQSATPGVVPVVQKAVGDLRHRLSSPLEVALAQKVKWEGRILSEDAIPLKLKTDEASSAKTGRKPEDYLNIVTIGSDGKASFASTSSFKEAAEAIEARGKQK